MFKEKICISRIDKMGDMILTLPVIKSIKIQIPNSEVHVLASIKNSKVLKNIKYIDKVFVIGQTKQSILKEIKQIAKTKYTYFFNFSPGIRSLILCFFSNSKKKASLILLSRYQDFFSKFFVRIFISLFCDYKHVVNRIYRLNNNQELHQTIMMFNLIEKCGFKNNPQNFSIDMDLPSEKISFYRKKSVVVHLTDRWINSFYSESDFLDLISSLEKKDYSIFLTTDNSTQNKFVKIYNTYKIISNSELNNLGSIKDISIILENLNFESWVKIIYSCSAVITPECGCTHVAAACKVPVNVIYDPENHPEAIHKEYAPWKSKYNKYIFNEKNLNQKLVKAL